jgi:hypothetical protein
MTSSLYLNTNCSQCFASSILHLTFILNFRCTELIVPIMLGTNSLYTSVKYLYIIYILYRVLAC